MSRFLGRLVHGQLNNFKELIKNVDILRTCLDKVSRESRLQQNAMRRPILEEHHHENYCDTKENLRAKVEELIASGTVDERDDQNTRLQKWYELVRYYYYIKFTHPDGPEVFTVLKKQISESDKKDMYNLICSLLDEYIDDHLLDNSKPEDQADTIKLNDILEYRKRVLGEDHSHIRAAVGENSGLGKTVKLDLGDEGKIFIDGASVPNTVTNEDKPADATVSMKWDDFVALSEGKLDPMMAFMQGKLKIAGDMMIAQKLAPLLKR